METTDLRQELRDEMKRELAETLREALVPLRDDLREIRAEQKVTAKTMNILTMDVATMKVRLADRFDSCDHVHERHDRVDADHEKRIRREESSTSRTAGIAVGVSALVTMLFAAGKVVWDCFRDKIPPIGPH